MSTITFPLESNTLSLYQLNLLCRDSCLNQYLLLSLFRMWLVWPLYPLKGKTRKTTRAELVILQETTSKQVREGMGLKYISVSVSVILISFNY